MLSTPELAPFVEKAVQTPYQSEPRSIRTVSFDFGSFRSYSSPRPSSNTQACVPESTRETLLAPPPRDLASPAALIYTSGTTGKPKACNIKSALIAAVSCPTAADTQDPSRYLPVRTYSCMPLFHATTFFIGLCYSVGTSGCFCLSRKFSARNFWKEVTACRATRILYVGELCRFLLATAESEFDRRHSVQVASGNGLQRDVWVAFQRRFGVPEIREFYRSTEGLVKYDNRQSRVGGKGSEKVAFSGVLKRRLEKNQYIVKFDYDNEVPCRDPKTGLCVPVGLNEAGEAIARIANMATYINYHGNKEATEAKIIRDVFQKGDAFQKSGDLLMQESSGWVKFVDRIGDTFRWKGENVSAGEIRAYIAELPEVQDVVVVGNSLAGYDGQAGVAAVSLGAASENKVKEFMQTLCANLRMKGTPPYALPRLVVITDEIKVGDTSSMLNSLSRLWSGGLTGQRTSTGLMGHSMFFWTMRVGG